MGESEEGESGEENPNFSWFFLHEERTARYLTGHRDPAYHQDNPKASFLSDHTDLILQSKLTE